MERLPWLIGVSLLGSVGAVLGAAVVLWLSPKARERLIPWLVSYATGTMLGAAFLGMLPEALRTAPADRVLPVTLGGLAAFFVLEKLVLWRHCHDADCSGHRHTVPVLLLGDGFHNFVDGIVIAAAFHTSTSMGITVGLAVLLHELPQELGDFAILLRSGLSRRRAVWLNLLSASTTLPGAALGWWGLGALMGVVPYALAVAAASFLYIALSDLVPSLHRQATPRAAVLQVVLLVAGAATIFAVRHGA